MNGFFQIISMILNFFFELVPNYAFAIAMLTLVVMLVTTPLTLKGTRSMIEMQRLQPEIRKLQAQYKDDRQKLNEEMMRFYKEHEINPLGGCLPLLIQMPVFIVLYRVVAGLTNQAKFVGVQRALRSIVPGATVTAGFRPKYLDHNAELYTSLLGKSHMNSFGIDLARSPLTALQSGFVTALPYLAIIAVIAVMSWYQQRQIMGRNPHQEMTSQQRMMMRIGPVMYVFFAFYVPLAVGVYFLVSTAWRVGQQAYITRSLYHGEDAIGVQAQKAMAEYRKSQANQGAGGGAGFLGGLLGGGGAEGRSGKAPAKQQAKGGARATGTKTGPAKPAGKASRASQNGNGARPGGQPTPPSRPHPRSRKKKKRK